MKMTGKSLEIVLQRIGRITKMKAMEEEIVVKRIMIKEGEVSQEMKDLTIIMDQIVFEVIL